MRPRERAARLSVLAGAPIELLRVRMLTADSSVWVAVNIGEPYADRAFLRSIADAGDRIAPLLLRYADEDRRLFDIPVAIVQDAGGWWHWRADPEIPAEIMARGGADIVGIAGRLADEILPIVVAAADAGEFP